MTNPPLSDSRKYLKSVIDATGLELSNIARKAGLSPETLTRPYNSKSHTGRISITSLRAVQAATGVRMPEGMDTDPPPEATRDESELVVGIYDLMPPEGRAITREEKRRLTREIVALAKRHFGH